MSKRPLSYLAGSMLLGTAIGAVAGLLTAPRPGRATREALVKKAKDAAAALPDWSARGADWIRSRTGRLSPPENPPLPTESAETERTP